MMPKLNPWWFLFIVIIQINSLVKFEFIKYTANFKIKDNITYTKKVKRSRFPGGLVEKELSKIVAKYVAC